MKCVSTTPATEFAFWPASGVPTWHPDGTSVLQYRVARMPIAILHSWECIWFEDKNKQCRPKVTRILEIRWAPFRGATFPAKDGRVQDCKLLRSHRSFTGLTHLPFLACQVIQCPGQSRPESLSIASLPERASFPHDAGVRQHRILLTRSFRSARIKRNAFGKGRTLAMLASKTDYVKVTSGMNIEEQQETSSPIQSSSVHSGTHKNLPQNLWQVNLENASSTCLDLMLISAMQHTFKECMGKLVATLHSCMDTSPLPWIRRLNSKGFTFEEEAR